VSEDFVSGSLRLLHHDGHAHAHCSVRMEDGLAQVGEEVSVVAVQLEGWQNLKLLIRALDCTFHFGPGTVV